MSNEIRAKHLAGGLDNFYKNYAPSQEAIEFLFKLYYDIFQATENAILQEKDNLIFSNLEAYRDIPYVMINSESATYTYQELLYNNHVVDIFSLEGKSLDERKNIWYTASEDEKVEVLSFLGKYVGISARRIIDSYEPVIAYIEVFDMANRRLTNKSDFILRNNKIFLVGDAALPTQNNSNLILQNIAVDYKYPEVLVGNNVGIKYNDSMTKPEYRDFMKIIIYSLLGGPTIKNLKQAFNTLGSWSGTDIIDMYSAKGFRKELWRSSTGPASLTPFDFLITIPAHNLSSEDKIAIFIEFLNVIKPAHTRYVISWSQQVFDEFLRKNDVIRSRRREGVKFSRTFKDKADLKNAQNEMYKTEIVQGVPVIMQYDSDDSNITYDSRLVFDVQVQTIIPEGAKGYRDEALIRHSTFPEIPLRFTAARSVSTGNVNISFKDNAQGITRYEVLRNNGIILTRVGSGGGATISLTDTTLNNAPTGTYTYNVRSVYEPNPLYPQNNKYSPRSRSVQIIR